MAHLIECLRPGFTRQDVEEALESRCRRCLRASCHGCRVEAQAQEVITHILPALRPSTVHSTTAGRR